MVSFSADIKIAVCEINCHSRLHMIDHDVTQKVFYMWFFELNRKPYTHTCKNICLSILSNPQKSANKKNREITFHKNKCAQKSAT